MNRLLRSDFLPTTNWLGWRRWVVLGIGITGIYLLGMIRLATDAELAFASLALFPVLIITWLGGRWSGWFMAVTAAFMWTVTDIFSDRVFSSQWIPWLNGLVRFITYAIVVILVAAVRLLLERERELATQDALTGLLNRRALLLAGASEVERARRYQNQLAVVFLDLDNFKSLNDTRGHDVGDQALKTTGKAMLAATRNSDHVSRLGGDEFVVVFPKVGFEAAVAAGHKIFESVNEALNKYPPVRASVGVAWFGNIDQEFPSMLKAADELMFEVKAGGKNNILARECSETARAAD
jgi:diguanylate cyclase (GGDEF)-like protein